MHSYLESLLSFGCFFFYRWQLGRMIAVIDCTRANNQYHIYIYIYIYIFIVTIRCTVQVHPIWNQHLQALFCLFLDETTWQVELDMGEFPNVSGWQIQVVLGSPCFMVKSCQNEIRCFFYGKNTTVMVIPTYWLCFMLICWYCTWKCFAHSTISTCRM